MDAYCKGFKSPLAYKLGVASTPWSPKLTHNSYCTQWNGQFGKPQLISLLERCRDALKYQEYSPKNHERTHGAEVGNIDYNLKLQILLPRREAIMKNRSNEWELLVPLHWRHDDHDGVSNHQPHGCLLNRFGRRSKKTSKLRVTGFCVGNSPGPVNSPHKGPLTRKMFPFDDVIMVVKDQLHRIYIQKLHCQVSSVAKYALFE